MTKRQQDNENDRGFQSPLTTLRPGVLLCMLDLFVNKVCPGGTMKIHCGQWHERDHDVDSANNALVNIALIVVNVTIPLLL